MRKNLITSLLMTLVTTIVLGLVYPLAVTALAQVIFPAQADGQLIERGGRVVGSILIGQPFSSPGYFRPRPSTAGPAGYDAGASGGSNLGPTNSQLIERVGHRALVLSHGRLVEDRRLPVGSFEAGPVPEPGPGADA